MQHPKTDDKRLPMADKEHHPKSLLNRYGTILRWIKEICNQGDSFAWDKPQADHQERVFSNEDPFFISRKLPLIDIGVFMLLR